MTFDRAGFERGVGQLLQAARSKRGMTQEEIAESIGVPRGSYANLEAGRQRIPVDVLWRAAVVLGVSVVTLLPESVSPPRRLTAAHQGEDLSRTTSRDLTPFLKHSLIDIS
jgi:transcriptional regulator with XRE-family HTH domain